VAPSYVLCNKWHQTNETSHIFLVHMECLTMRATIACKSNAPFDCGQPERMHGLQFTEVVMMRMSKISMRLAPYFSAFYMHGHPQGNSACPCRRWNAVHFDECT
jgi:hypothetical protein